MEEALRPTLESRRYKVYDNSSVREFYSILRAAIKGARAIGWEELLINDQTVPKIMGKCLGISLGSPSRYILFSLLL
jgi:hypothetical protein